MRDAGKDIIAIDAENHLAKGLVPACLWII